MGDSILELKGITKVYPGVVALDDVSICFQRGEVHAIVGENGAGKSTLIKTITGAIEPTHGIIVYNGIEHKKFDPIEAIGMGIGAVYQEFNLIPYLSVAENIFYGREIKHGPFYDMKAMCTETEKILNSLGVKINPRSRVKDLSVAYQQIVEIAKSVSREVKVLILDEPSAPLTHTEINSMFNIIKSLKEKGVTIIYISHRLEEIFEISDRVTVMRDSRYITTMDTKDTDRKCLISLMVGRDLGDDYPRKEHRNGETLLEVKSLNTAYVRNISFKLRKGEILGFAGLVGAGRTEVARAVFGADPVFSGEIILKGKRVAIRSPQDAIKHGIGLIPEDRKRHGVLLGLSIRKNITFSSLKSVSKFGYIDKKKENGKLTELKDSLRIKTPSLDQRVKNLSGGNQQKVVLAKWLATHCDILIFDEPTRGIDIGAKQEIYKLMKQLAESGKALIMISSEMPELLGMSSRIVVMHEGDIVGELDRSEATQERILDMASRETGGKCYNEN